MALTKDEKFLLCLYDRAREIGDPYVSVNRYAVGRQLGLHTRVVDNICRDLCQANFTKKAGKEEISLTPNGERLVLDLTQ